MAITKLSFICDSITCLHESDEFETEDEAREFGWFILYGPERDLGGRGERVYCSRDCMLDDLGEGQ